MERAGATTLTVQQALDLAVQHHQSGRLGEAEGVYRRILSSDPDNPHALHLLGVLASQVGKNDSAVEYIRRAIALNPTAAQYQCNLGAALVTAGRNEEAVETYRRVLVLQPDLPEAHLNLGVALMRLGKFSRAVESLEAALKNRPNDFKTLDSLGSALSQDNRQEEAIAILQRALAIRSNYSPTHHTLGNAFVRLGRFDEAITEYRAALALRPSFPEVQCSLSGLLSEKGETDEAIDLARRSLALVPNSAAAYYNLGRALHKQTRLKESETALRRALELDPKFHMAHAEIGNVFLDMKRYAEAIESFTEFLKTEPSGKGYYNLGTALWESGEVEKAIAQYKIAESTGFADPRLYNNLGAIHHQLGKFDKAAGFFRRAMELPGDFPLARFNLSMLQLLQGDFKDGWAGYESRWNARSIPKPARYAQLGTWDGGDLSGRRILLDCEQGFGDSIQFARYITLIAHRGGKPILATQPDLRRLLKTVPGVEAVICPPEEIPAFDVQCPLLSLAHLMGTTLESIPAGVPYLSADPVLAEGWKKRVPQDGRVKIGLCWSGSPKHLQDRVRSIPAQVLGELSQFSQEWYCSLQKNSGTRLPDSLQITDWTSELADFADTAALVANLDLVISCDTAVAHLAGAMGKPVWLLLPSVADWRWLLDREDSPWYPTMRIFRQAKSGEWQPPILKVVKALGKFDVADRR